jgi:hypothetical protein
MGVISSYAFAILVGAGSAIAGAQGKLPDQTLSLSTQNCSEFMYGADLEAIKHVNHTFAPGDVWKDRDDSTWIQFLSTSYLFFPLIGTMGTVIFGLFFSACSSLMNFNKDKPVRLDCMSTPFLQLWTMLFPSQMKSIMQTEEDADAEVFHNSWKISLYCISLIQSMLITVMIITILFRLWLRNSKL